MRFQTILFLCLFIFTCAHAHKLSTGLSSNMLLMNQQVNLFQKRALQAVCTCPRCDPNVNTLNIANFWFSTEIKCPAKCNTGYYVSGMDLLISPYNDYHTYIIETTSTDTSTKLDAFSKEQTKYNVGECFSASGDSFMQDTTDYTTKITCKNPFGQCSVQWNKVCICSKLASKLLIVAPSLVVAGSKFTPEVRIVDSDGNIVPRNYYIDFYSPGSTYTSFSSNGVMKVDELTAPSSGTITLRASISTTITNSAPSLTSAELTITVTQNAISCFGIPSSSSNTVCNGKGTCTAQDICSCFSGYSGSKCETTSSSNQVSNIKLSLPSNVNSGSAFTATVSMMDSNGNTLKTGSGTITLTLADGSSSDITMSGEKSKVAVEGMASFSVELSTPKTSTVSLKASYQTLSDSKSVSVELKRSSQCGSIYENFNYLFTMTLFVLLLIVNY